MVKLFTCFVLLVTDWLVLDFLLMSFSSAKSVIQGTPQLCLASGWLHFQTQGQVCWASLYQQFPALHCTALYYTTLHSMSLYCTVLHCTPLHCAALNYTVLNCTKIQFTIPDCTAMHYTSLYSTLHCTSLHCKALHFTAQHQLARVCPSESDGWR